MNWIKPFVCFLLISHFIPNTTFAQVDKPGSLAEELSQAGDALREKGKYEEALSQFKEAGPLFEAGGNWSRFVYNQMDIAVCLFRLEQFAEMEKELLVAEKKADKNLPDDHKTFGYLYHMIGIAYSRQGDYPMAIEYEHRVLGGYEKSDDNSNLANLVSIYNNLGVYYNQFGDYHKAAEFFEMALNIQKKAHPEDELTHELYYNNLIPVFKDLGDYPQALSYGKLLLNLYDSHSSKISPDKFISTYNNLASTYSMMGENDSALFLLRKALRLKSATTELYEKTSHNLGFVFKEKKDWDQAIHYLNESIEWNKTKRGIYHPDIANAYRQLGVIYTEKDEYSQALLFFQKAFQTLASHFSEDDFRANPSLDSVSAGIELLQTFRDKAHTLGLVDSSLESKQIAHATRMLAVEQMDRLRMSYVSDSKHLLAKKYLPMFEEGIADALFLFQKTGEERFRNDAFYLAEKSKSMILLEAVQESQARIHTQIPDSILQKEIQINLALGSFQQQIFEEKRKEAHADNLKIARWKQKVFDLKRSREQLIEYLEKAFPRYYELKYETQIASLGEIQRFLEEEDKELITFFLGRKQMYFFHLTPEDVSISEEILFPDFEKDFMAFLVDIQDYNKVMEGGIRFMKDYENQAMSWFEFFLKKAYPFQRDLIIVPDGLLGYLPFEALVTSKALEPKSYGDLHFLLKEAQIHYAYSTSLMISSDPLASYERNFAGFAPAYSYPKIANDYELPIRGEFIPLRFNQPEVETIAQWMQGKAFLAEEATESMFKAYSPGTQILHLAMHGIINDKEPLYSGLAFSNVSQIHESKESDENGQIAEEDGFLHAYELYALKFQSELVVLSACNTGKGKLRRGEGIMSLSRAFRYAGCANQIMSLWQAEDLSSFAIMENFYSNLRRKKGKAAALRQAKLFYLENYDQSHPFFWANYVLVGDDRPVNSHWKKGHNYLWYFGGIFLLLLGGIWVYLKRKNHLTE